MMTVLLGQWVADMLSGEAAGRIRFDQLVEGARGKAKLYHVAKL